MASYDEFRVVVTPDVATPGSWSVRVDEAPIKTLVGRTEIVAPTLTRAQLTLLRTQGAWPNNATLRQIGASVWTSLLSKLEPALDASRALSSGNGRGLRLVFVRNHTDNEAPPPGGVALSELPFEAIFQPAPGPGGRFFGTDTMTPLIRSLRERPDLSSYRVDGQLRVMIVAAQPLDMPAANAPAEAAAILAALQPIANQVSVKLCAEGTYSGFRADLEAFRPHVVHFVGHGAFAAVGDDPTPLPHLCFVDPASQLSWHVDAEVFAAGLQNSEVRLVVLTACSSAAAAPTNGAVYSPGAVDGLAQTLVFGSSGVRAAVAMQFDFEGKAAEVFSRVLYTKLLDSSLDEAVAHARVAITQALGFGVGHRAWVSPVVYSRCIDHKVFDIDALGPGDPATVAKLRTLEESAKVFIQNFDDAVKKAPPGFSVDSLLPGLRYVDGERAAALGQCVRLTIESAAPNRNASVGIRLLLAKPTAVGLLQLTLILPSNITLAKANAATANTPTGVNIVLPNLNGGIALLPGEHEVARLTLAVAAGAEPGAYSLSITGEKLMVAGAYPLLRSLPGVLFVERA